MHNLTKWSIMMSWCANVFVINYKLDNYVIEPRSGLRYGDVKQGLLKGKSNINDFSKTISYHISSACNNSCPGTLFHRRFLLYLYNSFFAKISAKLTFTVPESTADHLVLWLKQNNLGILFSKKLCGKHKNKIYPVIPSLEQYISI